MSELLKKLETYADSDYLPMHMPGHKRRMGDLGNPFFIDITEIDGFDDLHHAEGILKQAEERAAELYGSEETHYLVNGSTSGILASISGCTAAGGTILLARNSHKSAYHAVLLRGLHVHYIYPQPADQMLINGPILASDVEKELKQNLFQKVVKFLKQVNNTIQMEELKSKLMTMGLKLNMNMTH